MRKKGYHPHKKPKRKSITLLLFSLGLLILFMLLIVMQNLVFVKHTAMASATLWGTDNESGTMSGWYANDCGGEFNSGNGVSEISSDVAHSGTYSVKMTIDATGSDTGVRLFRWCEPRASNSDLYYTTWFYIPTQVQVTGGWWNIFQFKSKYPGGNDPYWIVNVGNRSDGSMYLYLYDWVHKKGYEQSIANLPVGRWFELRVFLKRAADESGRISVWQDGRLIFDIPNVATVDSNAELQWSIDNYANELSPSNVTIYTDDAAISSVPSNIQIAPIPVSPSPSPTPDITDFLNFLKLLRIFIR